MNPSGPKDYSISPVLNCSPAAILVIAAIYAVAAKLSFLVTIPPGNVSPIFPSAGIALAAVLILGRRALFGVWLGSFLANTLSFFDGTVPSGHGVLGALLVSALIGLGATCGAGAGAFLVRRLCNNEHPLYSGVNVLRLVMAGALGGCMISATIGVLSLLLTGHTPWERFAYSWITWWVGDAAGAIVAAPLILAWHHQPPCRMNPWRILEAAALGGATLLLCLFAFFRNLPFEYGLIPLLLWSAFRFGMRGATTTAAVIALLATIGTWNGSSPFIGVGVNESLLLLYSFLGVAIISALFLAGILEERKRAEVELRRVNRALRTVSECNQALVLAPDEATLMTDLCCILVAQGAYRLAWVGFAGQDEARSVRPMAQAGFEEGYLETLQITWADMGCASSPTGTAIRTGKPCLARDILTDRNFVPWREGALRLGYASSLVLPLKTGDRVFGALSIYSVTPDAFDAEETKLLTDLANDMAYGITALRTRTLREQAELALRESERRLCMIGDNLPDSYVYRYTHGADGTPRFLYLSAGVERIHGVKTEDVLRDFGLLQRQIQPEQLPSFLAAEAASLKALSDFEMEVKVQGANGHWRWLLLRSHPHRKPDGQTVWDGVAADITARKQAESALQHERDFSAAVLNSLPGVVYCYDTNLRFQRWNKNLEHVTGYTAEEITRLSPLDLFEGANKELVAERIREVFSKGRSEVEAYFVTKNGTSIPYYFTGLSTEIDGKPHLVGVGIDISTRKRAEEAVRLTLERYRRFVDANIVGVVVANAEGSVLEANDYYLRLTGYTREELEQGKVDWRALTPPEWRPMDDQAIQEVRQRGTCNPYEKEYARRDGTRVPVFLADTLLPGPEEHIAAFVLDLTERKKAEAKMRESERKYRELVEHANSIILHWGRDGRIIFLNEFGQHFFGYKEAEIRGRNVIGTIVPETESSGRNLQKLMDEILAHPEAFEQNVNENMRRNGERVWIAWTNKTVLDEKGHVAEILSIGLDITARKRAEEELQATQACLEQRVLERTAELAAARDRAESADRVKSAFLATMSHELRTPLNSIIGFTGLLLQGLAGPLNAEQAKQLGMVKISGKHLLALINDVLDISKIEAGQIEIACAPFNLREAIEKVVETVTPLADRKRLPLIVRIAPEVSGITSDRRRVEQIMLNLLSNAIKFTEQGEITLAAEIVPDTLPIPVSVIRLSVADTGPGIKPEDLDKLFQPFRQLDTGLTRQHEGTGLGLAICKRLVERMDGTIAVASEWGKGSTFQFTLPIQPERNP